MKRDLFTLGKHLLKFRRIVRRERDFLFTERGTDFRRERIAKREVVADTDESDFGVFEIAVASRARDLVEDGVVVDVVDLVQHDDDGTVEFVEFVPEKTVDLCLRVAGVTDLIRGVTERIDEANRDLITRVQTVAVDLDDGEGDIVVPGGVFLEMVQEKSSCSGFSDPAFPYRKMFDGASPLIIGWSAA